jgi:hypothetical protein
MKIVAAEELKLMLSFLLRRYILINSPALAGSMLPMKPTIIGEKRLVVFTSFTERIRKRHRIALNRKVRATIKIAGIR